MTFNQKRKIFSKLENKKIKIYCLGGGRRIPIKRPYSLKRDKKRKIIRIYCGRDEISSFGENVTVATIEGCILDHKFSSQREQKEKERRRKMWDVLKESLKRDLPPGFSFKEDEDFVHLVFGSKSIATFNSRSVNPEAIRNSVFEHLKKRKEVI